MSRLFIRSALVCRALVRRLGSVRAKPTTPKRILIAHQLLLGDTLMTTALVAKLRARHPDAMIAMAMPPAFVPLYAGRPFGLEAIPFSLRDPATVRALLDREPWDWAILPGDNRFSWLSQAAGAGWITGWADDRPATKNWLVDEARRWPANAAALGDLWADLIDGPAPREYSQSDWQAPGCRDFEKPTTPYVVLHVGASNPRKFWSTLAWQQIAKELRGEGHTIVLSAGRGEEALTKAVDPAGEFESTAGKLNLAQLFSLLRGAALLVAPDTGVAHLGKVTGTPTIALFGRGPTELYARGNYWSRMPFTAAILDDLPPRPQPTLFRRPFPWLAEASSGRPTSTGICQGAGAEFVLSLARERLNSTRPDA